MYRRLNITLREDLLARADAYAERERYSRSGLIAAALDAFVNGDLSSRGAQFVREPAAVYAPEAVGLNPAIRHLVPDIIDACRRHGAVYAALVGSSTQPDPAVRPADLDLLVRFPTGHPDRGQSYLGLLRELREITGLPVDLIEVDAVRSVRLRREFERTQVVLYEAA